MLCFTNIVNDCESRLKMFDSQNRTRGAFLYLHSLEGYRAIVGASGAFYGVLGVFCRFDFIAL